MINVVAALIEKDHKVFIAKRSTGNKDVLGKWEFPGGKVKEGETEENAIEREIEEELNLKVEVQEFLTNSICVYPSVTVNLKLYRCKYISGELTLIDHLEYQWVEVKDLSNYDMAQADLAFVEFLKKGQICKIN